MRLIDKAARDFAACPITSEAMRGAAEGKKVQWRGTWRFFFPGTEHPELIEYTMRGTRRRRYEGTVTVSNAS